MRLSRIPAGPGYPRMWRLTFRHHGRNREIYALRLCNFYFLLRHPKRYGIPQPKGRNDA